jgi:gamma-glutamyltranspeptidase/glutathione hydrolase
MLEENMLGFPKSHDGAEQPWPRRRPYPMYADRGMVAAAHPMTVAAGLHVLRSGGNAVDVAVAAGLAAAVVMPEMCGLGGDLFALVSLSGQPITSIQGSGIAPRQATIEEMRRHSPDGKHQMPYQGPLAIAVPGMVDAYFTLLRRFGTKSFAEVAEPATAMAREGFALQPLGAHAIAANADLLRRDPAAAAVFLPGGKPPAAGTLLKQPGLAKTLETLAKDGRDTFYRGEIGQQIAAHVQELGGRLAIDDMRDHETALTAPIETSYRGYTIYETCIPSQGLILLESLNIVEAATAAPFNPTSVEGIHTLVEAKKLAYADRLGFAGDSAFGNCPTDLLLSKNWAETRATEIDPDHAQSEILAGVHQDGDTTYLCVIDGDGAMVSLIQSVSSAFGSGVVGGETGVVMNNRAGRGFTLQEGHPNIFAPGKKTMHTLNCYLIGDEQGRPVLVGGTPGGDGQPQWNMQAITGLIDMGLDAQATVELPRWTSWPGTDPISIENPFELRVEDRLDPGTIAGLDAKGHDIRRQGPWGGGGAAQIIARDPETGVLIGGSDPRAEGLALGY